MYYEQLSENQKRKTTLTERDKLNDTLPLFFLIMKVKSQKLLLEKMLYFVFLFQPSKDSRAAGKIN